MEEEPEEARNCSEPDFPNEKNKDLFAAHSVIAIISVLGIIGNGISGVVLNMPQMRSSYNLLLFALTVSDSTQLFFFCLSYGSQALWYLDIISQPELISPIYPFALFCFYVAHTISIHITVLLSFERYIAVCKPFKAHKVFPTKRRSCCYILIVSIFSILFNLPKWLELELCQVKMKVSNPLQPSSWSHYRINNTGPGVNPAADDPPYVLKEVVVYTRFFHDGVYRIVYRQVIDYAVNFITPIVFIIVFNIWISKEIRQANLRRQSLTLIQLNDSSKTLMLIGVVFAICVSPAWLLVKFLLHRINVCVPGSVMSCQRITIVLLAFNASINFVIYCLCGSKFRQQLLLLLGQLLQWTLGIFRRNKH
ncbi:unnamed protein product [Allacma fusca]|uniref:G-protein coupled receptors family 1 profile domain-containing protein n=1 Tax=Allacma fusca TaxID=39272 RepID=A0A8J2KTP5_9HEXA|nr:unnamed protein product [Allacma fusca]